MSSIQSLSNLGSLFPGRSVRHDAPTKESNRSTSSEKNNDTQDAIKQAGELIKSFGLEGLQNQANIIQSANLSASQDSFSVSGTGFQLSGLSESFSFSGSFQQGNQLLQLNLEVQRTTISFAATSQASQGYDIQGLLDKLPEDARALVDSFLNGEKQADYFSPESTADRISSFALSGFASFEKGEAAAENSKESRQRYLDYISPAIKKGFQEALDILGVLPDQTNKELQQTRDNIQQRLASFLEGGTDQEA